MGIERVSKVHPITQGYCRRPEKPQKDACKYKIIDAGAKVEGQPDVLGWFDRVDRVMEKVWPWIFGFAAVYILAQLARWLLF